MAKWYNVLFYNGDAALPEYYVVDTIQGPTPGMALNDNLLAITESVREVFSLGSQIPDRKIHERMCMLEEDVLIPILTVVRRS